MSTPYATTLTSTSTTTVAAHPDADAGKGPFTWASIASQQAPVSARAPTWDFTPFLSSPAVQQRSRAEGQVNLLHVPNSTIASPLARNLSVGDVLGIRAQLVGEGVGGVSGSRGESGMEQWLCWRRAWDVWNNHYVEGRMNRVWVRGEYERRVVAERGWERGREERRMERERERVAAAGDQAAADPDSDPLLPDDQVPHPHPPSHGVGGIRFHVPRPKPTRASPRTGAGQNVRRGEDTEMSAVGNVRFTADNVDDVDSASDSDPPDPVPVVHADGSSGGWKAMKDLPDYYEPCDDDDDGSIFVDKVVNTVWRPRRVGETTPKILLDQDVEEFSKNQELEVDGGVDCGRSPFPVLHSITVHVRTKQGAYRKKKSWDHVTGTLFNMPTQPLEPGGAKPDPKAQHTKAMYEDDFRDHPQGKIFPLDIRRVLKVAPGIEAPRDFREVGEELVRDPSLYPEKKYRAMIKNDPWWVTENERTLRDNPPRRHPLDEEAKNHGGLLPLDDQLWQEESLRDLEMNAAYFVTNLDGGKLVINGMEVRKGDVAGPLPDFAVIETPGQQVSFWFGIGGRNYAERVPMPGSAEKWNTLRQNEGWEDIALPAGEVWAAKIKDRMEREKTGENEDDDEEWERYKRAKKADPVSKDKLDEPNPPSGYGPIPSFKTDIDELKWLCVQDEEKQRLLDAMTKKGAMVYPTADAFFAGYESRPMLKHELSKTETDRRWNQIRDTQTALQLTVNEAANEEKANRMQKERDRVKRKADDDLESERNRKRMAIDSLHVATRAAERVARNAAHEKKMAKVREKQMEKQQEAQAAIKATFANRKDIPADQLQAYWQRRKEEAAKLEEARQMENKRRTVTGQPHIKPAEELDPAAIEAAFKLQSEEAERREEAKKRGEAKKQADAKKAAAKMAAANKAKNVKIAARKPTQTTNKPQADKLLNAAQNQDPWSKGYKDMLNHEIEDILEAAKMAAFARAASLNKDPEEYLREEGYDSMDGYLAMELHKVESNLKHAPKTPKKGKAAQDQAHFQMYVDELKELIRDGIEARAREMGKTGEEWARTKPRNPQSSLAAMVEVHLKRINLTPDQVPSRQPTNDMSMWEQEHQKEIWRKWRVICTKAQNFVERTRNLPAPGRAKVQRGSKGRKFCEV